MPSKPTLNQLHTDFVSTFCLQPERVRLRRRHGAESAYMKNIAATNAATKRLDELRDTLAKAWVPFERRLAPLKKERRALTIRHLSIPRKQKKKRDAVHALILKVTAKSRKLRDAHEVKIYKLRIERFKLLDKLEELTADREKCVQEIIRTQGDKFVKVGEKFYDPAVSRRGTLYLIPHDKSQPSELRARASVRERAKRERARARAGKTTYFLTKGVRL